VKGWKKGKEGGKSVKVLARKVFYLIRALGFFPGRHLRRSRIGGVVEQHLPREHSSKKRGGEGPKCCPPKMDS